MKVLEFTAESFHELIVLRRTKNFTRNQKWIDGGFLQDTDESKADFKKYFVLSEDKCDSDINAAVSILEVLYVEYFPKSNCGFVKFLRLESGNQEEDYKLNCEWGKSLIKEAEIVLNKVRETLTISLSTDYYVGLTFYLKFSIWTQDRSKKSKDGEDSTMILIGWEIFCKYHF